MKLHKFSDEEIAHVQAAHPSLSTDQDGNWHGEIAIDHEFDGHRIQDRFQVRITAPAGYPDRVPFLREVGRRTQKIARKYDITDLRTLHRNPDNASAELAGTACVCVKQEEKTRFPPGSNLATYIDNLAIPYLYGLSFYDEFGYWPWPEYSHGVMGLLEFYWVAQADHTEKDIQELIVNVRAEKEWKEYSKQVRKPNPEKQCPCGSRKPFAICHEEAWKGLRRLHADIGSLGLNPRQLFHAASHATPVSRPSASIPYR